MIVLLFWITLEYEKKKHPGSKFKPVKLYNCSIIIISSTL